jgi:hypothetical protein
MFFSGIHRTVACRACWRMDACACFKEHVMKTWFCGAMLASFSMVATAAPVHVVQVINDTHSRILSFSVASVNSQQWAEVDFSDNPSRSDNPSFGDGAAVTFELHGGLGCLRDFRTVLSDGRQIIAHHIDVCRLHTYRPSVRYYWDSPAEGSVR